MTTQLAMKKVKQGTIWC